METGLFKITMNEAIARIRESLGIEELEYQSKFYCCAVAGGTKVHATLRRSKVLIETEKWETGRDPEEPMHEMSRREIGKLAFIRLRDEQKTDAALRLAYFLIDSSSITLGIGDIDWEIECALRYCGGKPPTVSGHRATMSFIGHTTVSDPVYRRLKVEFSSSSDTVQKIV